MLLDAASFTPQQPLCLTFDVVELGRQQLCPRSVILSLRSSSPTDNEEEANNEEEVTEEEGEEIQWAATGH